MQAEELRGDRARLAAVSGALRVALANRDAMDRLAELAATVMDAPVGMVNLVGDQHQHLVGLAGLGEPYLSQRRVPADAGYCSVTTLLTGKPEYLEDAAEDPAFANLPAHRRWGFVAYAGAPLRDPDGHLVGALCVADYRARRWRQVDRRALEALAESVVSEMVMHRSADGRQRLLDAFDRAPAAIAVTRGPRHVVEYHNAAYRAIHGDLPLGTPGRSLLPALMDQVLATGETYAADEAPLTLRWPGEEVPRERFFDFSYSAIGRGTGGDRGSGEAAEAAQHGVLVVAVEVTERVLAHRVLERLARHRDLLARANAALNRNLDPAAELQQLARVVIPELADVSTVHLLARPVRPGVEPPLPVITDRVAVAGVPGRYPLPDIRSGLRWNGDGDPITETIRAGVTRRHLITTSVLPSWAVSAESDGVIHGQLHHLVMAPVIVDGLVVAIAAFSLRAGRSEWRDDELAILGEVARYAGIALGHSMSHQRTRDSALILQRSLLTAPPQVEGLEIGARYQPAGRDEVGGDWYDAFLRRPDQLALTIGDVVGHDIRAAAAMAQLRALLRGLTLDRDDGPAAALDRLAAINTQLGITAFATSIHAHLSRAPGGWLLRWANAGHPPPMLVVPGSATTLLEQSFGPALVGVPAGPRTDAEIMLPPGSTLLLYTDGLIEQPGTDIDDNLAALARRATAAASAPVEEFCDMVLRDAPSIDDVALLAVRV